MRRKSLIIGMVISILSLVAVICLVWWNEQVGYSFKKQTKAISVSTIAVDADNINPDLDGHLVYVKGNLSYTKGTTGDYKFDVYVDSPKLIRLVEKYQYKEVKNVDKDGNVTYTYEKVWSSSYINSSKFNDQSLKNKDEYKYNTETFYADDLAIGKHKLSTTLKDQILATSEYTKLDELVATAYDLKVNGKYYTDSEDINNPQIGDIRISFLYSDTTEGTILAMQSYDSFITFTSNKGTTYNKFIGRVVSKDALVKTIYNDNDMLRWQIRLSLIVVLFILMYICLRPLSKTNERIIFFGKVSTPYLLILSLLLTFFIFCIEAALVWLLYNPLIALVLFIIAIGCALAIFFTGRKNNEETKEEEMVLFNPEVLNSEVKTIEQAVNVDIPDTVENVNNSNI